MQLHLGFLAAGLSASLFAPTLQAQSPERYPDKAVRLAIGFQPGSQPDIIARMLSQGLSQQLGKPMVVDNVAGAGGNIAAARLAKTAPDGYTLGLLGQGQMVLSPSLYALDYDTATDFSPITQVTGSPLVLVVSNSLQAKSVGELIALARAHPGDLTFASGGTGSATHLPGELFKSLAHLDIRHIPYKGAGTAMPDVIAGRVSLSFLNTAVALPLAREGKVRLLAVSSARRLPALPDVPTVAESGLPGFEATNWYGLVAPAKTPVTIVQRLRGETVRVLAEPATRDRLAELGLEVIGNTPEEFSAAVRAELPRWAKVIKDAGIKGE